MSSEPELGFRPGNITYMTPRQAASRERNPIPEETKRAIRKVLRKGRSVYSIARRYDVGRSGCER
jgi:transposase-like protein